MIKNNEIVAVGESQHCFVSANGMPVRLKKDYPEIDEIFNKELEKSL